MSASSTSAINVMNDRLKELYERGATGLDRSPGDSLCYWAHGEILNLRAEVERLRSVLCCQGRRDEMSAQVRDLLMKI